MNPAGPFFVASLAVTYFRAGYTALSSARRRFTVLFGMGRRGSGALWPPGDSVCGGRLFERSAGRLEWGSGGKRSRAVIEGAVVVSAIEAFEHRACRALEDRGLEREC